MLRNCHCNVPRVWAIPHTLLNVLITEKLCILVTLAQGGWYNYWSSSEETWWLSISTKSTSNQHRLTTVDEILPQGTTRATEQIRKSLWEHCSKMTDCTFIILQTSRRNMPSSTKVKIEINCITLLCVESLWNLYWKYTRIVLHKIFWRTS